MGKATVKLYDRLHDQDNDDYRVQKALLGSLAGSQNIYSRLSDEEDVRVDS